MIRGITVFLSLFFLLLNYSIAGPAQSNDIEEFPFCKYCGMDRNRFAYSRMLLTYEDGSIAGMCSLHCAGIDIALNIDTPIAAINVGDYLTNKLINAETAYWVIGGDKAGVMTRRAKWAFENGQDADTFITENGGELAGFEAAAKASFEDMYEDIQMTRKKRKKNHK